MNIELVVFLDKTVLITKLDEITTQLGEPDCLLVDPYIVNVREYSHEVMTTTLEPWLSNYTYENKFKIHSDKILTITEPSREIKNKYLKLIGEVEESINEDTTEIAGIE